MAHILIIDDDDIGAELAVNVLLDAGHAAGWVPDAETAMDLFERRLPDLVLLDQNMPGENGTALLRRLRNSPKYYDLPVIMLTGAQGHEEEQIARFSGAQDYIRKPLNPKMLLYRINLLLKANQHTSTHRTIGQRIGTENDVQQRNPPVRMI